MHDAIISMHNANIKTMNREKNILTCVDFILYETVL